MNVHRGRAAAYAVLALAIGAASYAVGVGSFFGQRAEARVLDASDFTFDPPMPLSLVSVPTVGIALILIAALALWAHGIRRAITVLLCSALAIIGSQMLKQQLLVRPDLFELDVENSFPSGHMTVFAVLAASLIWASPSVLKYLVALIGTAGMGVVSWQLLEYGWHRPSDLIGALALAVFSFSLAALFRSRRATSSARYVSSFARGANRVIGFSLTITAGAVLIGGLGMTVAAGWFGSAQLLLAGAQIALIGASAMSARVFLALSP